LLIDKTGVEPCPDAVEKIKTGRAATVAAKEDTYRMITSLRRKLDLKTAD
jgi:hypothetical protein